MIWFLVSYCNREFLVEVVKREGIGGCDGGEEERGGGEKVMDGVHGVE